MWPNNLDKQASILIVGAGIAGLTTAVWLHQAGYRVRLLDAGQAGQESTWAGGGIVSAVPPWAYPENINQRIARSRELYPDLIERLQTATGIDCEYQQCGLLLSGWPEIEARQWLAGRTIPFEYGQRADFEPALNQPDDPVIVLPEVSQVRSPRLGRALIAWLKQHSVIISENHPVERILVRQKRAIGIRLSDGREISTDGIVIACGAWTDRLLQRSGLNRFGIRPIRGQMLLYRTQPGLIRHIINTPAGYLIPRTDGRILAGSTVEPAGFDRRPNRNGFDQLSQMAHQLLPELTSDRIELHWSGLRPGIDRDEPLCGAHPGVHALWLQSGGFRNGLGMAPANAEYLSREIVKFSTETVQTVNS